MIYQEMKLLKTNCICNKKEVDDLQNAGIKMIQVDEAAFKEVIH